MNLVSRSQTAFFRFYLSPQIKTEKSGLATRDYGELPLAVLCRELPDFGDCSSDC